MIQSSRILFIAILLIQSILMAEEPANEEYHYVVNYLMFPSLDMKISINYNHEFNDKKVGEINVTTKTKKFFDKIFSIDNQYSTFFDPDDKHCLFHRKKIRQPNVTQTLQIEYETEKAVYSNGDTRLIKNMTPVYDFFSMLVYLRSKKPAELDPLIIDMEGEYFYVDFRLEGREKLSVGDEKIITNKINLVYKKVFPGQQSVLDYTDIFFWKLAEESGKKYIWLEEGYKNRIIKAKFSEGRGTMEAKLVASQSSVFKN